MLGDRGYFDVSPRGTGDRRGRRLDAVRGDRGRDRTRYLILRPEQKPRVLEALVQLSSQPPRRIEESRP